MAPLEYEIASKQWPVVPSLNFKNHRISLLCFQNFKCGQSWATLSEKIVEWNFCGLAMASPRQLRPEMFRSQRDGRIDRSCRWEMGHVGFFSRRYQAVCRNFQLFQGRNWEVIQFRKCIAVNPFKMNERIKINGRDWKASIQIPPRDKKTHPSWQEELCEFTNQTTRQTGQFRNEHGHDI